MNENKNCSECSINGICSITGAISSLHEIVLLHIKNLAFYILKLKEYGITNDVIKNDITAILYGIFINVAYSQDAYQDLILKIDKYLSQSIYLYENYCKENNLEIERPAKKLRRNQNIIEAIKNGEKTLLKKYKALSYEQKSTLEVVHQLCKALIIRLVELQRLGVENKEFYYSVLALINICNAEDFHFDNIENVLNENINIYIKLLKQIYATQKDLYGDVKETEVDMSSFKGKSILVSGADFQALKKILEQTRNLDINIYTHGFEMLVAHTLPEIAKYPHLKGHFSANVYDYISDFSKFPGPILMSRVYMENVDFLYRGRLFSQDTFVTRGIEKIEYDDYSPLIKATSQSKGFKKHNKRAQIIAGYNETEIIDYTDKILMQLKTGEIKNLFIIGTCNCDSENEYFEELLDNMPENSFAFSFAYKKSGENIFHINSYYDERLFFKIFRDMENIKDKNISLFYTKGDRYTVANLLSMNQMGFRHVFSENFPEKVVTSQIKHILESKFNIEFISESAKKDIETIMY